MKLAAFFAGAFAVPTVTVVPWCENSFRVMVTPVSSDTVGVDPPGGDPGEPFAALIDKCGPGASTTLAS